MAMKAVMLLSVVSFVTLCLSAAPASAEMFGFVPITGNSNGAVAPQLSLEVTGGAGVVSFTFRNNLKPGLVVNPEVPSSITSAYFDNRTAPTLLKDLTGIVAPEGVSFAKVRSGNLPGGKNLLDDFVFSFGAEAKSKGGVLKNGVQPGEYVTLTFSTPATVAPANVVAALRAGAEDVPNAAGTLRVGIHVQGIGTGNFSDAFVLDPPPHTPVPGAFLLGVLGLGTAGWKLRRFI